MSPWEMIGWAIAVPVAVLSLMFVYAVSVAAVRATVNRGARRPSKTATNVTPLKRD